MKRTITLALAVTLLLTLALSISAMAQGNGPVDQGWRSAGLGNRQTDCPAGAFVDEDGDGVCDLAAQGSNGAQYGRRAGRGLGMMAGHGRGQGIAGPNAMKHNFTDADEDGLCDNFVDADNDGICDNCSRGAGRMMERGRGWQQSSDSE